VCHNIGCGSEEIKAHIHVWVCVNNVTVYCLTRKKIPYRQVCQIITVGIAPCVLLVFTTQRNSV